MRSGADNHLWLRCSRNDPKCRLRLFCFPYAGGGASVFRNWQQELSDEIQVCPIQLPGRQNRLAEQPFTSLPRLAEAVVEVMQPLVEVPFALFGHSMGALVSFEVARQFRRTLGVTPAYLFVASRRAPHMPDPFVHIASLPDHEFLVAVRRFQGTPSELLDNEEMAELILPALRADIMLCETYSYVEEAALDCPISALAGSEHDEVTAFELRGWKDHSNAGFKLRMFPGGHFFLEDCRSLLIEAIKEDLVKFHLV